MRPLFGAASTSQAIAPRNGGVTNSRDQRSNELTRRHVRARDNPGDRRRDQSRYAADAGRNGEAYAQRREQRRVREQPLEIGERRRAGLVRQPRHSEPKKRQPDQPEK